MMDEDETQGVARETQVAETFLAGDHQKKKKKKEKKPNNPSQDNVEVEVEEEELKQNKKKKRKKTSLDNSGLEPDDQKKKRKKKTSQDKVEGEPSNPKPRESKEMKRMRTVFEGIQSQITDLNRHLLTLADIGSLDLLKLSLDAGELLLTWRQKWPDLISEHDFQQLDDCWAYALARALAALMKQHGVTDPERLPTAQKLRNQIDKSLLSKRLKCALRNISDAAPLLLEKYGAILTTHHHPRMDQVKENEEFEKFIERRLALGPVAMCFHYVRGYDRFQPKNKEVFRPTASDIESIRLEKLDDHCAVITGRGVVWIDGEPIEFWEIHETQGDEFADGGFTRLERYKGLINEVYEFQLVS